MRSCIGKLSKRVRTRAKTAKTCVPTRLLKVEQAGAELGQAQLKLELDLNSISLN